MNKRGFTLIELLAVILILGIIALIAVPTVNNVINEARLGAEETTANQLVSSAETYYELCQLKNDETCVTDFTTVTDSDLNTMLNVKGDIPKVANITTFTVVNGQVSLTYTKDGMTCTVTNSSEATCTR